MRFSRELIADCLEEAKPLLEDHYEEIAHFKSIPLDPDYDQYLELEKMGIVRCFVARNNEGAMIGYATFFVRRNIHYKSSLQSVQDIIYINPSYRGQGGKFLLWCDEQLKAEGVQVNYHHIKSAHNWGKMAERMGYELIDLIYGKRFY